VGLENVFKQKEDRVAVVKEGEVRIHAGPDKDEPVKAVLEKGEQVHVIIMKGAWLKVINKEDDEIGWIRENTVVWSRSPKGEEKGAS
jgi:SH3-like domain-containing protein